MYKDLLNVVKAKIDIYGKHKELSGENFNIFSIMSMESDEVFTHSAIIAELLNPKGSHSLGRKPLELFIDQFKEHFEKHNFQIDYEKIICKKEEFLCSKVDDETLKKCNAAASKNFRYDVLDIVVKENDANYKSPNIFCIENKIYAGEQEQQLHRYKSQYPNGIIFYLTLTGEESKQVIQNENNEIYVPIAYVISNQNNSKQFNPQKVESEQEVQKSTVLNWLQECVKYAYDKPMVREVLNQYIFLIKKLTNQTTNEKMKKEIIDLIKKNLEASTEIHNNYEDAVKEIQIEFLTDLKTEIKKNIKDWSFKIHEDEQKKVFGIYMSNEKFNIYCIFRFNKYNEAALNIINYLDGKGNTENVQEFLIEGIKFKKNNISSTDIYAILDKNVTPSKITVSKKEKEKEKEDSEKEKNINSYTKKIELVLNFLKVKQ